MDSFKVVFIATMILLALAIIFKP